MPHADTPPARPCLVMLPGTLCDGRIFARQARALHSLADVVRLDYAQLRGQRDWVAKVLRRLPARFALAGFSLGGLWALELLRAAPERVDRLALIGSNAAPGARTASRRSDGLWKLWRGRGPSAVAKHVKPAYFHHEGTRRRHARLVQQMALDTPRQAARQEFNWAALRPAGYATLRAFERPLLIVAGAQDRLCPPALQHAMQLAQPSATRIELQRCGHFVPLEAPADLNRALARWLQAPSPPHPKV